MNIFYRCIKEEYLPKKKDLMALFFWVLLSAAGILLFPFFTSWFLDVVLVYQDRGLWLWGTVIVCVSTGALLLWRWVVSEYMEYFSLRSWKNIEPATWYKVLQLTLLEKDQFLTEDLAMRFASYSSLRQWLAKSGADLLISFVTMILGWGLLVFFHRWMGLAALSFSILFGIVESILCYKIFLWSKKYRDEECALTGFLFQSFCGIPKIKTAAAQRLVQSEWSKRFHQSFFYKHKIHRHEIFVFIINQIFIGIGLLGVYGLAGWVWQDFSAGELGGFLVAYFYIGFAWQKFWQILLSGAIVFADLARTQEISDERTYKQISRKKRPTLTGSIEIENLSFCYPEAEKKVFESFSLLVEPGEMVSISGDSGSGKTTLLKLLLGLLVPQSGRIVYDAAVWQDWDQNFLRSQLGTVLEGDQLMSGDILGNILLGSGKKEEDAWQAAEMAGVRQWIESLPMGMKTYVGEGLSTFSGGEKSKILLARALVRQPKILFLDGATTALDPASRTSFHQQLQQLKVTRIITEQTHTLGRCIKLINL